jgi:hypothetical protein
MPKVDHVIWLMRKKVLNQPLLYKDIDLSTASKVLCSPCNDLFNKINRSYFPKFTPQNIPEIRSGTY